MASPVAALRKLTKLDSTHEHQAAYVEQLAPETNHRGACLILTANVETALDAAIQQFLRLEGDSHLLDDEDLYSAFSRKIALGYALRIYGKQTRNNLTYTRHIRNAFAHAKIPLTFDTPEVKAVCDLFVPLAVLPPSSGNPPSPYTPRQQFENVAQVLAHNLIWWSLEPVQALALEAFTLGRDDLYPDYYRRKAPLP
jgi:hypothetical protein